MLAPSLPTRGRGSAKGVGLTSIRDGDGGLSIDGLHGCHRIQISRRCGVRWGKPRPSRANFAPRHFMGTAVPMVEVSTTPQELRHLAKRAKQRAKARGILLYTCIRPPPDSTAVDKARQGRMRHQEEGEYDLGDEALHAALQRRLEAHGEQGSSRVQRGAAQCVTCRQVRNSGRRHQRQMRKDQRARDRRSR